MKQWIIDNIFSGKARFMSFIGFLFVSGYLGVLVYQVSCWNIYLSKARITPEVYERLVTGSLKELVGIITMIVVFYFRSDDKQPDKTNQ